MVPPAPPLLSTTTGTPSLSAKGLARSLARASVPPPGAKGTTKVMARFWGKDWPKTGADMPKISRIANRDEIFFMKDTQTLEVSPVDRTFLHQSPIGVRSTLNR